MPGRFDDFADRLLAAAVSAWDRHQWDDEDAPRSAAYAALDILHALETYAAQVRSTYGVDLAVRIGVHTGLVALTNQPITRGMQEAAAVGPTPNIAARVQTAAKPNS